jgi:hypothetical protein
VTQPAQSKLEFLERLAMGGRYVPVFKFMRSHGSWRGHLQQAKAMTTRIKAAPRQAGLQRMVLYTENTGARDDNVCGLRWSWEVPVPELRRSVFVIPAELYKGKRPHVQILSDVAWNVVEKCRGMHDEYVFVYRRERVKNIDEKPVMQYDRVDTMNNTGFQSARKAVRKLNDRACCRAGESSRRHARLDDVAACDQRLRKVTQKVTHKEKRPRGGDL